MGKTIVYKDNTFFFSNHSNDKMVVSHNFNTLNKPKYCTLNEC